MKPKLFFVLLNVVFCLLLGAGGQVALAQNGSESERGPELKISETSFHAGAVAPGSTISHEFVLENVGDKDLEILQAASSCGSCAVADYDKIILPGKKGRVAVNVTYDPAWAGETVKQSVIVVTNDPKSRYVNLILRADVKFVK